MYTYRRRSVKEKQIGIMLVHNATATVCSLRTRGMLAGTKLHAGREQFHLQVSAIQEWLT